MRSAVDQQVETGNCNSYSVKEVAVRRHTEAQKYRVYEQVNKLHRYSIGYHVREQ